MDESQKKDEVMLDASQLSVPNNDLVNFNYEEVPITDIVNNIILDGIKRKASDIHFDPYEKGLRSLAFCCISTGEFHFPNEEGAKIAIETVLQFQKKHPDMTVVFNVFKNFDYTIYQTLLKKMFLYRNS